MKHKKPHEVRRKFIKHFRKGQRFMDGVSYGCNGCIERVFYSDGSTRLAYTATGWDDLEPMKRRKV